LTLNPPAPSAPAYTLNSAWFRRPGATLGDVSEKLVRALEDQEYVEYGFYCVPNGFALATRIERISDDRRSWQGDARWQSGNAPLLTLENGFSMSRLLNALFRADPGRYRMIVFYVTDRPVTPTQQRPGAEFRGLPSGGESELPDALEDIPFGPNYRVRAFIYEFRRPSVSASAEFVKQTLPAYTHLDRAGLIAEFKR
jgi:hypothetical protein